MSVFIKMALVMMTNVIFEITLFNHLLPHKKSPLKLYCLVLGRKLISCYMYSLGASYLTILHTQFAALSLALNTMFMIMLIAFIIDIYLVPDTSSAKVLLVVIGCEIISGLVSTIVLSLINMINGIENTNVINFNTPFQMADLLYPLLMTVLFMLIIRNKFFNAFIHNYRVKYPALVMTGAFVYFFGSILTEFNPIESGMFLQNMTTLFLIVSGIIALVSLYRRLELQNATLKKTQSFVEHHYETINERIDELDAQRTEINNKMTILVKANFPDNLTKIYLEDMVSIKNSLYQSMYTHYYVIDAFLSEKAKDYQEKGIEFNVSCASLDIHAVSQIDVCHVLSVLCRYIDTLDTDRIYLKMASLNNQLIITAELSRQPVLRQLTHLIKKQYTINNLSLAVKDQTIFLSLNDG